MTQYKAYDSWSLSYIVTLASLVEIHVDASSSRDSFTYSWYAALSHRPNVFIVESSIPAAAAVDAAPMRKLWPAYFAWLNPAIERALRNSCTKMSLVRNAPCAMMKSGPGALPRMAM